IRFKTPGTNLFSDRVPTDHLHPVIQHGVFEFGGASRDDKVLGRRPCKSDVPDWRDTVAFFIGPIANHPIKHPKKLMITRIGVSGLAHAREKPFTVLLNKYVVITRPARRASIRRHD